MGNDDLRRSIAELDRIGRGLLSASREERDPARAAALRKAWEACANAAAQVAEVING